MTEYRTYSVKYVEGLEARIEVLEGAIAKYLVSASNSNLEGLRKALATEQSNRRMAMANYKNAGHGPRNRPDLPNCCKHENTAAAPGLEYASVWCPDCKRWVVLHERPEQQENGDA